MLSSWLLLLTVGSCVFPNLLQDGYTVRMVPTDIIDDAGAAWERQAKNIVRSELMRRGMSQEMLIGRLAALGVVETLPNLRNKLSRGRFTAVWLLQILAAIGVERLQLPEPPGTPSGDAAADEGGAQLLARGPGYRKSSGGSRSR